MRSHDAHFIWMLQPRIEEAILRKTFPHKHFGNDVVDPFNDAALEILSGLNGDTILYSIFDQCAFKLFPDSRITPWTGFRDALVSEDYTDGMHFKGSALCTAVIVSLKASYM